MPDTGDKQTQTQTHGPVSSYVLHTHEGHWVCWDFPGSSTEGCTHPSNCSPPSPPLAHPGQAGVAGSSAPVSTPEASEELVSQMRCPCWFLVKFQCDWNPCYPAFSPAKPLSLSEVWEASQGMSSQAGRIYSLFPICPFPHARRDCGAHPTGSLLSPSWSPRCPSWGWEVCWKNSGWGWRSQTDCP